MATQTQTARINGTGEELNELWTALYLTQRIRGFAFNADIYCVHCTIATFGLALDPLGDNEVIDSEGNQISPIFVWTDDAVSSTCGGCHDPLIS